MKKHIFTLIGLLFTNILFGQIVLSDNETGILKDICNQYNLGLKESSLKELRKTAPVQFQNFIEQMIATKDKPKKILEVKYLKRPSHEELIYWYVVREFHYNNSEPDSLKKTQDAIVSEILKDSIEERWLLDNYYYRISGRLKFLFNEADLSKYNFQIDELGFKNETEKAIFFFHIINSCGQRLSVMSFTGKGNPRDVIKRFPKINGTDYFYFSDFNYPDFDWIGYKKLESYNSRQLGVYYEILFNHLKILLEDKKQEEAKILYNKSILSKPELFKYSSLEKTLIEIYEK